MVGVPNRTSDISVPIIEPPQPSPMEARMPWTSMSLNSAPTPMCTRCIDSTISRSMLRGRMFASFQILTLSSGARLGICSSPFNVPNSSSMAFARSSPTFSRGRSMSIPYSFASRFNFGTSVMV